MYDLIIKWEYFKMLIKDFILNYLKRIVRFRKKCVNFIEVQIKLIELKFFNEINMNYKCFLEREIDMYYIEKCKGVYIRLRVIWIEKGEKSILYFYNLEKKYQFNNNINQICDENDIVYIDNDNIMKCLYIFYNLLYVSKYIFDNDIDIYLFDI